MNGTVTTLVDTSTFSPHGVCLAETDIQGSCLTSLYFGVRNSSNMNSFDFTLLLATLTIERMHFGAQGLKK